MRWGMLIEVIRERRGRDVVWSDVREATEDEVKQLMNSPCDHAKQPKQLIYDECGWMYDTRYCAVCKCHLGYV